MDLNDWDERLETLIERVFFPAWKLTVKRYLEISPTGQVFHETFEGRFESDRDRKFLPPAVLKRVKPALYFPITVGGMRADYSWVGAANHR
ncbi:MAG: hypothetical protein IPK63_08420 [Candidatus Competibacteraceae bacterium]|nr:hypothetical protein [Candidatus Competibacteraceae bacterium]